MTSPHQLLPFSTPKTAARPPCMSAHHPPSQLLSLPPLVLVLIINRAEFVHEIDGPIFGSRVLRVELSKPEFL